MRFLPIAALLVLGLAIRMFASVTAERRGTTAGIRSAAWAVGPLVLSMVVMGIAFAHWYGSPLPSAPYRLAQTRQAQTLSASWATLTGAFWSAQRAWLPFAPIGILALACLGYTVRRYRLWALFGLAVAGAYLLTVTLQGSDPGFSFAGRYEVILIPFAAFPLLIAATDLAPVRWVMWPLVALTLYLTVAVVLEPPPAVAGVPGVTGPGYPSLLWSWFVHIWPEIIPSAAHFYPDAGAVLGWSSVLLAISVAGYFICPRTPPGSLASRRRPSLSANPEVTGSRRAGDLWAPRMDRIRGSDASSARSPLRISRALRGRDVDRLAGGGVASLPRGAVADAELAEAGKRDLPPGGQLVGDHSIAVSTTCRAWLAASPCARDLLG